MLCREGVPLIITSLTAWLVISRFVIINLMMLHITRQRSGTSIKHMHLCICSHICIYICVYIHTRTYCTWHYLTIVNNGYTDFLSFLWLLTLDGKPSYTQWSHSWSTNSEPHGFSPECHPYRILQGVVPRQPWRSPTAPAACFRWGSRPEIIHQRSLKPAIDHRLPMRIANRQSEGFTMCNYYNIGIYY